MTTNSLQLNQSVPVTGLATFTYTFTTTGLYTVRLRFTCPYQAAGSSYDSTSVVGQSALQIVVNNNGSPVLTLGGAATSPTPTQGSVGGSVTFTGTSGQSMTVVTSSANAVDALPNAVKGTINLFFGE